MRHATRTRLMLSIIIAFAATALAGCANAPLRTEASTSGIRAAEEAGAEKVPRAALHLQKAKEELESARKLGKGDEEDREKAQSMLTRAEADAELAILLSHEESERNEAKDAVERVRQLRLESQ